MATKKTAATDEKPIEQPKTKEEPKKTVQEKPETSERSPRRVKNSDFFSRDILGGATKDRLKTTIDLKSHTGKSIFRLTYGREGANGKEKASIDNYLHRPKELATLMIARDQNNEMQKQIENRLTELEKFVQKRQKQVTNLYKQATSIEKFDMNEDQVSSIETGFSTGHSKRFLEIIKMIDDTCYKAGYLEKVGIFNMKQEVDLNSALYRRTVTDARILMSFIGRAVILIRRQLREQKSKSDSKLAS